MMEISVPRFQDYASVGISKKEPVSLSTIGSTRKLKAEVRKQELERLEAMNMEPHLKKCYLEGYGEKVHVTNPYDYSSDIGRYCAWEAGHFDRYQI